MKVNFLAYSTQLNAEEGSGTFSSNQGNGLLAPKGSGYGPSLEIRKSFEVTKSVCLRIVSTLLFF